MIDPRAKARDPRPIIEDSVALGVLLEGPEPPLALAAGEVEMIVGWPLGPLRDAPWEFAVVPGFAGLLSFSHEDHLVYRRDDGRVLRYEYEGALAYALAADEELSRG